MQVHLSEHLPKDEIIQLGSYYTPEKLVQLVHEFIKPYLKNNKKDAFCLIVLEAVEHFYSASDIMIIG